MDRCAMVKVCDVCKVSCIIEIWQTNITYFDDCASQLANFKCMEEMQEISRIGFSVASFQTYSFIHFGRCAWSCWLDVHLFIHSFWNMVHGYAH